MDDDAVRAEELRLPLGWTKRRRAAPAAALNLDGVATVAQLTKALQLMLTFRGIVVNLDGVIAVDELAAVLNLSRRTIFRGLRSKTFPIPPLPRSIGDRLLWSGPIVRQWLERNGRLSARRAAS
jgi:predicted DNA-binding transcriptional regulator AlpA